MNNVNKTVYDIEIANLVLSLVGSFDEPRFPEGTEFFEYELHIPFAAIPKPDGGLVCAAFDCEVPRPFPAYQIVNPMNETLSEKEFLEKIKKFR